MSHAFSGLFRSLPNFLFLKPPPPSAHTHTQPDSAPTRGPTRTRASARATRPPLPLTRTPLPRPRRNAAPQRRGARPAPPRELSRCSQTRRATSE